MSNAGLDQNSRQTLTALANDGSGTIVTLWADPTTHRLLVDTAAGSGTVTSVSIVSANGFAGTVATATTTPAITLTTTITGLLKGNGTAISAATEGTDYYSTPSASTTPTASKLVLRDSNANIFMNNMFANSATIVSAAGTTVLTIASARFQSLTGSSSQTFQLPNATTLTNGHVFTFNNNSSGSLIITNTATTTLYTIPAGGYTTVNLLDNGTEIGRAHV